MMSTTKHKSSANFSTRAAAVTIVTLVLSSCSDTVMGFFAPVPQSSSRLPLMQPKKIPSPLSVSNIRDADYIEMMVGGERYEMVPLPDSMVDTTCFVGNLCEFIKDDDLSNLFTCVSDISSVPACVARKPNMNSLHYGFVSFPSISQKEAAIIKFNGYELNGRRIKVEPILDKANVKRVKVPERLVTYMCGEPKKTHDGRVNTLRRVSREEVDRMTKGNNNNNNWSSKKNKNKQATAAASAAVAAKSGSASPPTLSSLLRQKQKHIRLNDSERNTMERAAKQGFVSLSGTAYRRGRRSSALANVHRQWSDARGKPQIILCKASGGRPLDNVIIDLSPLRAFALFDNAKAGEDFMTQWRAQILFAAAETGMQLKEGYVEDNTVGLQMEDANEGEVEEMPPQEETMMKCSIALDSKKWATESILNLPAVSLGVFEGERSKAKAMAKQLAKLWGIPEEEAVTKTRQREKFERSNDYDDHMFKKGGDRGKRKNRGGGKNLSDHRRRSRNPYYEFE
mmetsp:Transcript_39590/g.55781  ORF Transcript_39590/g.55781 Transcript_39590/m.55781 type:complete len:511 (+) Transcript_39590:209-1741(+)